MTQDSNEKYIDEIITILEANENLIQYDYKGKESQTLVSKDLIDKINIFIDTINDKKVDLDNLLINAIREGFELTSTDIVISISGNIFIKHVEKIDKIEVSEADKDTVLNRFSGISEGELKAFYSEFFADNANKDFFPLIAKNFVEKYFHEKKITNENYEKSVFAYIHSTTLAHLVSMYDNSDGFFQGFAGYVFRIHFKEVFEHIADLILDEISRNNKYIVEFLNYYSSDIIVIGENKFKVPAIEAKGGLRWNVISMLSIAKIYTQTGKSIRKLGHAIAKVKSDILSLHIDELSPLEYQTAHVKNRQYIEMKISETTQKLDKYLDSLRLTKKEEDKSLLQEDIKIIENKIKLLRDKKKELANNMIKQSRVNKYQELQTNMDTLIRELTAKQRIITQNIDAYQSMRNSLVKALTSKKKKL